MSRDEHASFDHMVHHLLAILMYFQRIRIGDPQPPYEGSQLLLPTRRLTLRPRLRPRPRFCLRLLPRLRLRLLLPQIVGDWRQHRPRPA